MPSPGDFALPTPAGWLAARDALKRPANAFRAVPQRDYAAYDRALKRLARYGPDLKNGYFNHAPMVVETLCALGQGDRAEAWIAPRVATFTPRPPAIEPIKPETASTALGRPDRFEDWARFFTGALDRQGWRPVLDLWARRLAPGFTSAAAHGVLQTAHAARALADRDTPTRRAALVDGLAAWASRYRELPVEARPLSGVLSPTDALAALTSVPPAHRPGRGAITAGYRALVHAPDFAGQVAAADLTGSPVERLDDILAVFAQLFLDAARTRYHAIVFTHAVTGAAAAAVLARRTSRETGQALMVRAWEAGCALKAAFASPGARSDRIDPPIGQPALAAVRNGDDHVIKLTEACLSAHMRRPDPVFLRVIARVQALIPAP